MAVLAVLVAGLAACGKRGAPLPPLPRVPGGIQTFTAVRRGDAVDLAVTVPTANASGNTPADIARIEVYAVTAFAAPRLETGRVPDGATLVGSMPVRRPLPPPPPPKDGQTPAVAPMPPTPGVNQGEQAMFHETLTPALVRVAEPPSGARAVPSDDTWPRPVVFERAELHLKRYYMAAAVSARGRMGGWSAARGVPVAAPSGAPSAPVVTYDAANSARTWAAAADAWTTPAAAEGVLDARPLGPVRPPTRYNVYAVTDGTLAATPLNPQPLPTPSVSAPGVVFDQARCFAVRGVDTFDDVPVEGPASPPGCVTARDTFPPAAPTALEAVGSAGVISLIWEGVEASDLAGYVVLRGENGGEPTTVLTPEPIGARSFEDRRVRPGVRYVYVVVAVDSAAPANRSAPSNRAEETARQ
ncbi:MAG: hypothetical protein U0P30_02575 [Vicinamibacterales bacterium]